MEKHADNGKQIPLQEAMKLAGTPQGQAILNQLKEQHGDLLQSAILQAQSGNYEHVKKMLSGLLQSPEGKALLEQMRR